MANIKLTNEENELIRIVVARVEQYRQDYGNQIRAKDAMIALLESKYNAKFCPETGQFELKTEEKPK